MKVLLVNPSVRPKSVILHPNVGLGYIATALKRAGVDMEILDIDAHRYSDEQIIQRLRNKRYDIIGIGTLVSQYKWAKGFTRWCREAQPQALIVAGNTLGTSVPETLLTCTDVDVAVLGEGDATAVDLVQTLSTGGSLADVAGIAYRKDGQVHRTAERKLVQDLDTLPFIDYDLFDMDIYVEKSKWTVADSGTLGIPFDELVALPVNTARGCPFRCTFCYHAFQNKKYRYRSPENICDEIQHLKSKYGANYIFFWDELTFFHRSVTEKFVDTMIDRDLGIRWTASCRSELFKADDHEIVEKVKKSGCQGLGFALETGNDEILLAMNKRNQVSDFVTQAQLLQDHDLKVYSSIVFGYPQETEATIADTFNALRKARVYASVGYLQPMPGTVMFKKAQEMGVIDDEESYLLKMGDRQDLRVNLTQMEQDDMEAIIKQHLIKLNEFLKIGLSEQNLIKTTVYQSHKMKPETYADVPKAGVSFYEDFGVAGEVLKEAAESPSVSC